ncbi:MAG: DNA adenine methylase [Deltaproteobacteria bacterium]|nr:DNA adenine methylase [Deltaproteobacteria bacterium]
MIKYLGSKRQLIPQILKAVHQANPGAKHIIDLFSGTSRVGHALKRSGFKVSANDHNTYAYWLAKCYVETDLLEVASDARNWISKLNKLPGKEGYFTETFCLKSRFFHPKNGMRVDAIREVLANENLEPKLFAVLLVSLMEAADRVDSTCGIQMSYLKSWAPRALQDLGLRLPDLLPASEYGPGKAHCLDALEAAKQLEADVIYIDPPYNQHNYRRNYHIWETLALWDKPESYGIAAKRIDCKTHKSAFNLKTEFMAAFSELIANLRAKTLIVSFNNEGFMSQPEMESLLAQRGKVSTTVIDYKRYVGAQIGIYNPKGERVGKVSHLKNKEFLYSVKIQ